jgi:hypothetical protein
MFAIAVERKDVVKSYPMVKKWMKFAKKANLRNADIEKESFDFFYTCGFFVAKSKNNIESLHDAAEKSYSMLYEDRLEEEMRKVRVGLTIKSGDFAMTDMFPKGEIPEKVRKVVAEIVKTKMLLEYEYHKNDVVKMSIPEVDRTIADVKIEGLFDVEEEEEKIFEVDEILEKITKHGYENLSTEEKEFLDKKSRGEI